MPLPMKRLSFFADKCIAPSSDQPGFLNSSIGVAASRVMNAKEFLRTPILESVFFCIALLLPIERTSLNGAEIIKCELAIRHHLVRYSRPAPLSYANKAIPTAWF